MPLIAWECDVDWKKEPVDDFGPVFCATSTTCKPKRNFFGTCRYCVNVQCTKKTTSNTGKWNEWENRAERNVNKTVSTFNDDVEERRQVVCRFAFAFNAVFSGFNSVRMMRRRLHNAARLNEENRCQFCKLFQNLVHGNDFFEFVWKFWWKFKEIRFPSVKFWGFL